MNPGLAVQFPPWALQICSRPAKGELGRDFANRPDASEKLPCGVGVSRNDG